MTVPIPDESLDDLLDKIAHRKPGCGAALRVLRVRANMTQARIAGRFSRAKATWGGYEKDPPKGWPSRQLLIRALAEFGILPERLSSYFDLTPNSSYQFEDPLISRWELHQREMPDLLRSLYVRAKEGSDPAAKLLVEDYEQTEAKIEARASKAIDVSPRHLAIRRAWIAGRAYPEEPEEPAKPAEPDEWPPPNVD
jgi:transcriptional regulator with XRE-family HTH domain